MSRFSKIKNPTFKDYKRLGIVLTAFVVSATAVAIWKRAFKWGVRRGSKNIKEQLGIFQFDEKRDIDAVAIDVAKDTAKNLANISPVGKVIVTAAEKMADKIVPDGYNWYREPWNDQLLDFVMNATEGIPSIAAAMWNVTKLDNFVEEVTKGDIKHNEELADKIVSDGLTAIEFALDMGTTLTKTPLATPWQEFAKPFLRDSRIKIIREVQFGDVEDPQEFSQRVFDLFEKRSELNQKSKSERLDDDEQQDLSILDKFAGKANTAAAKARDAESESTRSAAFSQIEIMLELVEKMTE